MRMMWRGVRNWPFVPGRVEATQQGLVEVALNVLVLAGHIHSFDGVAGFDQEAGLVDLELGVGHVLAERASTGAEALDVREHLLFDLGERFVCREAAPV